MESEVDTTCWGVWFQNGWSEFASSHGVAVGHLLVFKYEGNSHIHVLIFDATAIEIDYTLDDELQVIGSKMMRVMTALLKSSNTFIGERVQV